MPLSQLYEIFRTGPRHAEAMDTRQSIQREDRKIRRRNNDENGKKDNPVFEGDDTTISVTSLKAFFYSLLAEDTAAASNEKKQTGRPATGQAAIATQAYQHGAETASFTTEHADAAMPPSSDGTGKKTLLTPEDQKTIRRLLGLLQKLSDKNIEHITLEPAPTFLTSIEQAINKKL